MGASPAAGERVGGAHTHTHTGAEAGPKEKPHKSEPRLPQPRRATHPSEGPLE